MVAIVKWPWLYTLKRGDKGYYFYLLDSFFITILKEGEL